MTFALKLGKIGKIQSLRPAKFKHISANFFRFGGKATHPNQTSKFGANGGFADKHISVKVTPKTSTGKRDSGLFTKIGTTAKNTLSWIWKHLKNISGKIWKSTIGKVAMVAIIAFAIWQFVL